MRKGSVLKRVLALAMCVFLSLSLFACNSEQEQQPTEVPTTTKAPLPVVATLTLGLDESTQKAYDSFFKAFSDNGYVMNDNLKLIHIVCEHEEDLANAAKSLVKENPQLIYAVGVDAALAAKNATTSIPVIFSCVNDPVGSGLVKSCEKPEANVTGVCDYSPVFEQIELMTTLYPDTQRIGCLYNAADEESILSANLASGEAQTKNVKFTMYPSISEDELYDNLDTALEKCDVLYLTDDALVKAGLDKILDGANEKNIPVFAESTELVESGCLATCITDYEHIGYSAGELGLILYKNLKPVSQMPVEYASECTPVINSDVQKALKLTIPDGIGNIAVYVKAKG